MIIIIIVVNINIIKGHWSSFICPCLCPSDRSDLKIDTTGGWPVPKPVKTQAEHQRIDELSAISPQHERNIDMHQSPTIADVVDPEDGSC